MEGTRVPERHHVPFGPSRNAFGTHSGARLKPHPRLASWRNVFRTTFGAPRPMAAKRLQGEPFALEEAQCLVMESLQDQICGWDGAWGFPQHFFEGPRAQGPGWVRGAKIKQKEMGGKAGRHGALAPQASFTQRPNVPNGAVWMLCWPGEQRLGWLVPGLQPTRCRCF